MYGEIAVTVDEETGEVVLTVLSTFKEFEKEMLEELESAGLRVSRVVYRGLCG